MIHEQPVHSSSPAFDQEGLLNRIANRIRQSLDLQEILTTTAHEVRVFLDTDRVKIYRFHSDATGEVVAESIKEDRLPSLLGLRFPAEDVPLASREMFVRTRQRVVVNVSAQRKLLNSPDHKEIEGKWETDDPRYAPVDPCHLQYLSTMGVGSSLTVPILHQSRLWGLLVSHHSEMRLFSERELNIVQLLVDQVSIAIAQANLLTQARQQAHDEATINRISSLLHSPLGVAEIRQRVLEETIEAMQGSGGRLYITADMTGQPAQLYTSGEQPTLLWLEETSLWQDIMQSLKGSASDASETSVETTEVWELAAQSSSLAQATSSSTGFSTPDMIGLYTINDLYQEPRLQPLISAFESTPIRTVLVVPLQYQQQCVGCLSVFRREIETETLWAGRNNPDDRNLRPRASFRTWRELKQGQAQEWTVEEVKLARSLSVHFYMAVLQRRVEDMIRHQASHDALTGLPNRLLFSERLSLALATAHQQGRLLAVIFLDLDRFKTINDTLGHAVGDQLLQASALRLKGCLLEGATLARWGGDEFTLLLPELTSVDEATDLACSMLESLSTPFVLEGQELYIKASMGIALAPYDGEDAETLLKHADTAMYRAKQQGKNRYQVYAPAMNTKAMEQLVLENNLHRALDRQEFLLHYQPQVDLVHEEIVAMEALVRWQHPELGLIPPNQFIPLAEENGLICAIGEWVLRTACAQNRAWQRAGLPPLRVAVNLSARQFQQQDLVTTITRVLHETDLDPCYLELEITESIAMQDVNFTVTVLQELRSMGIQVSMDDFGTGYSSLSSLINFPFHTLKIDRSFIRDSITNASKAAIVRAIVALGHGLNLKVIAEGVETADQVEFLQLVECDSMQGYVFSRPLPADAITQLYRRHVASKTAAS